MARCVAGCQCKRHTARRDPSHPQNSPEYRQKASQQMKVEWQKRHENPELMDLVSASLSRGHKDRWTPERRAAVASDQMHTSEARIKAGESRKQSALGSSINPAGYRDLHMQQGHPLARSGGLLGEHRKVLYDKIGPGEHPCYWCGRTLSWGGLDGIVVDHIDEDRLNNDPNNLVPSCNPCNIGRGK